MTTVMGGEVVDWELSSEFRFGYNQQKTLSVKVFI